MFYGGYTISFIHTKKKLVVDYRIDNFSVSSPLTSSLKIVHRTITSYRTDFIPRPNSEKWGRRLLLFIPPVSLTSGGPRGEFSNFRFITKTQWDEVESKREYYKNKGTSKDPGKQPLNFFI